MRSPDTRWSFITAFRKSARVPRGHAAGSRHARGPEALGGPSAAPNRASSTAAAVAVLREALWVPAKGAGEWRRRSEAGCRPPSFTLSVQHAPLPVACLCCSRPYCIHALSFPQPALQQWRQQQQQQRRQRRQQTAVMAAAAGSATPPAVAAAAAAEEPSRGGALKITSYVFLWCAAGGRRCGRCAMPPLSLFGRAFLCLLHRQASRSASRCCPHPAWRLLPWGIYPRMARRRHACSSWGGM